MKVQILSIGKFNFGIFVSIFMRALLLLLITGSLLSISLKAQPVKSQIISRLLREKTAVPHVHTLALKGLFLNKIDFRYRNSAQYLVKTSGQLYLGISGTGCLFRLFENKSGLIDGERVDSTVYAGNNFCAANFTLDTSIYSFGGYGFWKTNGFLKTYNPYSREWDIIHLNEERPSLYCESGSGLHMKNLDSSTVLSREYGSNYAPSLFWIDSSAQLFYSATQRVINEAIGDTSTYFLNKFVPQVSVLDIKAKKWTTLGGLIDYGFHYLVQTPWGLLVIESTDKVYLADFNKNQRRYCSENYLPLYRKFFTNSTPSVHFYANGFMYIGMLNNNSFDSISFNLNHFLPSILPLYRAPEKDSFIDTFYLHLKNNWLTYTGLLFFTLVFGSGLLYRFRESLTVRNRSGLRLFGKDFSAADRVKMITATEKSLIRLITTHSLKGEKTSIDQVNKAIGVSNKTEPVKRRVRSEIINSINEKWILISVSRERLIESVKSPDDGRTREYFIKPEILASAVFQDVLEGEVV